MPEITASGLKNMTGNVSDDGSAVIVGFETFDGQKMSCALNRDSLSKAVSFLLKLSEESAQKTAPENRRVEEITANPLPVAQIGVGRGRSDDEAILSIQFGILRLSFSTEPATLLGMCSDLQSNVTVSDTPRKPQ